MWAVALWQDIAAQVENLVVKVYHVVYLTPTNLPRQMPCAYNGGDNHQVAGNSILGLGKQVLRQHSTPERIESDHGTHFLNNLIPGPKRMALSGCTTYPIMHQPLGKPNDMVGC